MRIPVIDKIHSRPLAFNLLVVVGTLLVLYQYRYGLGMLNPGNDNWLMKHDWATHYLGWFFFRNEPWKFPIGSIANYLYPVGTNIGFTDSIPLAGIFFKVLSPILPHNFQYFGPWLFGSHVLLAYFTLRLLDQLNVKGLAQLGATLIVVFNPVLLHRSIHPALCSHWIIVASLWVYFLDTKAYSATRLLSYQAIIFVVASLINPYLSLIGAGFFGALAWRIGWFDKSLTLVRTLVLASVPFVLVVLLWFLIGLLSYKNNTDLGVEGGYGLYAFNLNSLFNSGGWSSIVPHRPLVSWHQYEGFMYLGLGVIILIAFVAVMTLVRRLMTKLPTATGTSSSVPLSPLITFTILISLFAITNVVTFDEKVLFTIEIPNSLLRIADIFRASGRYFWVFYYSLIILTVVLATRIISNNAPLLAIIFFGVFAIQLYDYRFLLGTEKLSNYGQYRTPLAEDKWRPMFEKVSKFEFYPPLEPEYLTPLDYRYFSYLAADYSKPINLGYAARLDNKSIANYASSFRRKIDNNNLDGNTLYIATPQEAERFIDLYQNENLGIGQLDGYYFFYPKAFKDDPAFSQYSEGISESMKSRHMFTRATISENVREEQWQLDVLRLERSLHNLFLKATVPKDVDLAKTELSIILFSGSNDVFISKSMPVTKEFYHGDSVTVFRGAFFTAGLDRGNYRIALLAHSRDGSMSDRYVFFGNLNVGFSDPYQAEVDDGVRMKWWIEAIDVRDQLITINGWAFLEGQSSLPNHVEVLLKSDSKTYRIPTDPMLRPDVTSYFNSPVNIGTCGFRSVIDQMKLQSGEYEIGIRITNDNTHQIGYEFTNRKIIVP